MKSIPDVDAVKNFLSAQRLLETVRGKKPRKTAPFVTLSRQYGAGGHTVADLLQRELNSASEAGAGWTVFDKDLVKVVLAEHGLPEEMARYLQEKKVSEIRDIVEELCGLHPPAFVLIRKTSETLLHLAALGHVILVGLGSPFVTRTLKGGLHVRLVGSKEKRIRHAADYYGISLKEAAKRLEVEDQGRRDYARQNFNADLEDPVQYDLVINTDHVLFGDAARLIADEVWAMSARLK